MANINPYLNFKGNTEQAFKFYKSVFGGEFAMVMRWKDSPEPEKLSAAERKKIMHIALPIGKGNALMATDSLESMGCPLTVGTNFHICVSADSEAEADRIFKKLAAGGKVGMPMGKTFWGAYFGMCTDKFDIQWMISYEYNQKKK